VLIVGVVTDMPRTGTAGDYIVIALARRNNGIKEPEMRLWVLVLSFIYAAVGYMSYGESLFDSLFR
jgi:hypothetical protein